MTTIYDIPQQSVEWFQMRIGKITGSKLKNIIDLRKKCQIKTGDPVITAVSDVISELLTGMSNESDFQSEAMEWGIDTEKEVIELIANNQTHQPGFVQNDKYKYFGMSPDLLEGKTNPYAGYEIKCPSSKVYVKTVINNKIPSEYLVQVLSYFVAIDSLSTMHFVVYDPRIKGKSMHKITIHRQEFEEQIQNISNALMVFDAVVMEHIEKFK